MRNARTLTTKLALLIIFSSSNAFALGLNKCGTWKVTGKVFVPPESKSAYFVFSKSTESETLIEVSLPNNKSFGKYYSQKNVSAIVDIKQKCAHFCPSTLKKIQLAKGSIPQNQTIIKGTSLLEIAPCLKKPLPIIQNIFVHKKSIEEFFNFTSISLK